MSGPVHLVDASLYVFRAWHSMPPEFEDRDGWPVNAVHGFTRFLLELLERQRPARIAVAFDESLDTNFRNELYPAYKANRDPAPEELKRQFAHCQRVCRALGLPVLADGRYEADDLIGSALGQVRRAGHAGLIISADKDLSQLLDADDEQWDYARNEREPAQPHPCSRVLVDPMWHGSPWGGLVVAAALAGLGIARLPSFLVADDLAAGRLDAVIPYALGYKDGRFHARLNGARASLREFAMAHEGQAEAVAAGGAVARAIEAGEGGEHVFAVLGRDADRVAAAARVDGLAVESFLQTERRGTGHAVLSAEGISGPAFSDPPCDTPAD